MLVNITKKMKILSLQEDYLQNNHNFNIERLTLVLKL